MDYFRILNLTKEPFSNSPEPEFFYQSPQHVECLQKLELAVRLRRGLNVVIGDVGTGKTTLCRQIIRRLADDENVETYLMIDPYFSKPMELLHAVGDILGICDGKPDITEWQVKEEIKNHLYAKGVGEKKTLVLIIDEGQKIPDFCFEILREFLNYETNEYKLLQIIIFAQEEFYQVLEKHPGFADRINFSYDLYSMNFTDTRAMIRFRLDTASGDAGNGVVFFTFPALWAVYRITGGYPRKIVRLCHQIILALIIQNRSRAGWALVRSCARGGETHRRSWKMALVAVFGGLFVAVIGLSFGHNLFFTEMPKRSGSGVVRQSVNAVTIPMKFPPQAVSAAEEEPLRAERCPESLGWLTIKRDGTICKVIRGVYGGECTQERIALIRKTNPHIRNPDRVAPGARLNLPAVPSDFRPAPERGCWVQVARKDSLEDVYGLYRKYPGQLPPIQIFSYWNGREGLKFAVILKKDFTDEKSAQRAIAGLPRLISSGAKIIKEWDEDTVFFSDVGSG